VDGFVVAAVSVFLGVLVVLAVLTCGLFVVAAFVVLEVFAAVFFTAGTTLLTTGVITSGAVNKLSNPGVGVVVHCQLPFI
jgi:hypothetical protein